MTKRTAESINFYVCASDCRRQCLPTITPCPVDDTADELPKELDPFDAIADEILLEILRYAICTRGAGTLIACAAVSHRWRRIVLEPSFVVYVLKFKRCQMSTAQMLLPFFVCALRFWNRKHLPLTPEMLEWKRAYAINMWNSVLTGHMCNYVDVGPIPTPWHMYLWGDLFAAIHHHLTHSIDKETASLLFTDGIAPRFAEKLPSYLAALFCSVMNRALHGGDHWTVGGLLACGAVNANDPGQYRLPVGVCRNTPSLLKAAISYVLHSRELIDEHLECVRVILECSGTWRCDCNYGSAPLPVGLFSDEVSAQLAHVGRAFNVTRLVPLLKLLLEHGAPANVVYYDEHSVLSHSTSLVFVAMLEDKEVAYQCARLLLSYGANVNAQSGSGLTALTIAANGQCAPLVELLLRHGANTALTQHHTCNRSQLSIDVTGTGAGCVKAVHPCLHTNAFHRGLRTTMTSATPLYWAAHTAQPGHYECYDLMVQHGADKDAPCWVYTTVRFQAERWFTILSTVRNVWIQSTPAEEMERIKFAHRNPLKGAGMDV